MPILSTWSENVLGVNPLVNGSAIISYVLICSIDTIYLCTSSLTEKYFNSIFCILRVLIILWEEKSCEIITINFQWVGYIVEKPKSWDIVLQPQSMTSRPKECHKFNFHSGGSKDRLLLHSSMILLLQLIEVPECWFPCVYTSGIIWIWIANYFKIIRTSIHKYVFLGAL